MLIIGERINATRKRIAEALRARDKSLIQKEAQVQVSAGASYLDLNAGLGAGDETEDLRWLVEAVQEAGYIDLCLDSANSRALESSLPLVKGKVMVNSINGEKAKMEAMFPLMKGYTGKIIGLTMDDRGIPSDVARRLEIAEKIITGLTVCGVRIEDIYLDPLVQPVGTDPDNGLTFLEAVTAIKKRFPGVKTTCGLSNVSFGLPERRILNRYFLTLAIGAGLDSALIDPTDQNMLTAVFATEGLLGLDQFCLGYLTAFREGKIK
ncbi:MAG: dihydropteroate synthase [Candidatus Omnitrophota bacterium]